MRFTSKTAICPRCHQETKRHNINTVRPFGLHGQMEVKVANYHCRSCRKYFQSPAYVRELVGYSSARYTTALRELVKERARNEGITLEKLSWDLKKELGFRIPPTTMHDWINAS